jgi:thiol-disulfide isomerase/thioredoxin
MCVGLAIVLPPLSDATRKVTVPAWACPVTKCSKKAIQDDIADGQPALDGSLQKSLLALRGAMKAGVLCPFGGDDPNAKKASKTEVKSFFDGFAKAYDATHGIKSKSTQGETQHVETQESAQVKEPAASPPGTVQKVDRESLIQLADKHDQDLLVVFYAPWCPHCQAFVLADNAPLNKLAEDLASSHGPKVVSFDTTASPIPSRFRADFIPTILLVTKDGRHMEFMEDPSEVEHLRAFALAGIH